MGRSSISVRGLAAIAAAGALLGFAAASAGAAPLALTSNSEAGSVSVVNTATGEYAGEPIDVGGRPGSIAVTPDARFAYVANEEAGSVSVIETATRRLVGKPIELGGTPGQIAISPDGKTAYVAQSLPVGIAAIDTRTDQVTEIPLGADPTGIAISPDGKTLYAAESGADAIEVVDTNKKEIVGAQIKLKESPEGVAVSPDGKTIYVGDQLAGLAAISATTRQARYIPTGENAEDVTVSPDGETAWVTTSSGKFIPVVNLRTGAVIERVPNSGAPSEIALTPDGKRAYVLDGADGIRVFDTQAFKEVGPPISRAGLNAANIAIAPDQSPTAAFTAPSGTVGAPLAFSGAASTDPDGSIVAWSWTFGDGGTATGVNASHAYAAAGTYNAQLSVVDNEGCGPAPVFTGRTAYCSGAPAATQAVTVNAPAPRPPPNAAPAPPSNRFRFGRIVHNRRNGTVRLQVTLPSAGFVLLFGKKVHAVTRKSKGVQTMWLTLHARVRLAKRLKQTLRAPVKFRVTFTPYGGAPRTVHRSATLQRAPRHGQGR